MEANIATRGRDRSRSTNGHLFDEKRSRPLGSAEQQELAAVYSRTRDQRIEHRLVEANLRLVVKLARALDRTRGHQLEDLVQEGVLGLIHGIRRFDPAKGAGLTTYAVFWIRAYMMKYIMDNVRLVRVGRTRAQRTAFSRGDVEPTELSFDTTYRRDATPLRDLVADPSPSIDEVLETAELIRQVRKETALLKSRLAPREVTILNERLLADQPRSLSQIGRRLSLSGERVRQIEGRLRCALEERISKYERVAQAA